MTILPLNTNGMGRRKPSTQSLEHHAATLPPFPRSQSFHYYRPRAQPPPPTLTNPRTPPLPTTTTNGHTRRTSRDIYPTLQPPPQRSYSTNTSPRLPRKKQPPKPSTSLLNRRPSKSTTRLLADARLTYQQATKNLSPRQQILLLGLTLAFLTTILYTFLTTIHKPPKKSSHSPTSTQNPPKSYKHPPKPYWPSNSRTLKHRHALFHTTLPQIQQILSQPLHTPLLHNILPSVFHVPQKRKPLFSIITACTQEHAGYLQQVLPSWIEAVKRSGSIGEIVVIDWGSVGGKGGEGVAPIQGIIEGMGDDIGVDVIVGNVINGDGGFGWVLTRAFNLAGRIARGDWLVKVDCDIGIEGGGGMLLKEVGFEEEGVFWRGDWRGKKGVKEMGVNGVFVVRKKDFWKVGGFDERLVGYGWDDEDLYGRFVKAGLRRRGIGGGVVHLGGLEGGRRIKNVFMTEVNRLTLERVKGWGEGDGVGGMGRFGCRDKGCRFLEVELKGFGVVASELLSVEEKRKVVEEANLRVLHDGFKIPWAVLSEVNRTPAELVKALVDMDIDGGIIFCEVGGTTAQRILGVASAIALARKYSRPLFVSWSSGKRGASEHVPRVSDFFDIENSGLMVHSEYHKHGVQIFQVGRWKCRFALPVCADTDKVYNDMLEYRTTKSRAENAANFKKVLKQLTYQSREESLANARQNVLLRLEGILPILPSADIEQALHALAPSRRLVDRISLQSDVSERLGIFLGHGIRKRGLDAMLRRLSTHTDESTTYFVAGEEREWVLELRRRLGNKVHQLEEELDEENMSEVDLTARDVAELLVLSKCASLVNDGRSPEDVATFVQLIKGGAMHRRW